MQSMGQRGMSPEEWEARLPEMLAGTGVVVMSGEIIPRLENVVEAVQNNTVWLLTPLTPLDGAHVGEAPENVIAVVRQRLLACENRGIPLRWPIYASQVVERPLFISGDIAKRFGWQEGFPLVPLGYYRRLTEAQGRDVHSRRMLWYHYPTKDDAEHGVFEGIRVCVAMWDESGQIIV